MADSSSAFRFVLEGTAQYVGRQIGVVCDAFGDYTSFSDFDLSDSSKPDPGRLTPELKSR
jgi:hypothetical protein